MSYRNEIIEEVRAAREAILARCDNDFMKLYEYIKALEATSGHPIADLKRLEPQPAADTKES
jgi:hypothetical protein